MAHQVRDYEAGLSFDPYRLEWLEERLHGIRRLTRRYGGDVAGALETLAQAKEELAGLDSGERHLEELRAQQEKALAEAVFLAEKLSQERREAAPRLAQAAEAELAQLSLATCRMQVSFNEPGGAALETDAGPLGGRGLEQAEILIAPNPGEGFRPLKRIASGGELSRMLLALRTLVARRHGAPHPYLRRGGRGHRRGHRRGGGAKAGQPGHGGAGDLHHPFAPDRGLGRSSLCGGKSGHRRKDRHSPQLAGRGRPLG